MEGSLIGKHFLLIAANHLASSPRLLKMMVFLQDQGAQVSVIYLETFQSDYIFDQEIIQRNPQVDFYKVSKVVADWLTSLKLKLFKRLTFLSKRYKLIKLFEMFHPYLMLVKSIDFDKMMGVQLIIAFNFDSLPVASFISRRLNADVIYDVEDLYAYSGSNWDSSVAFVEEYYYHKAKALFLASPFFKDVIKTDFQIEGYVIRNVFDALPYVGANVDDRFIKLVWFSQTVGLDRGLQDIIAALDDVNFKMFQLTIIGNCSEPVKHALNAVGPSAVQRGQILYAPLLGYYQLGKSLQGFDIGLSLERANSLSHNLCEANKSFQYLSAGIPFIASNTLAQKAFQLENQACSYLYTMDHVPELKKVLVQLMKLGLIVKLKEEARRASLQYSYSSEMNKIFKLLVQ